MHKSTRIAVVNGLFNGRGMISLREAIRQIQNGMARPVDIQKQTVNGVTSYTFSSIKLTFHAYDEIVAGSSAPKGKQSAAVERAMHSSDYACNSIPAVQKEDVYNGSRDEGTAVSHLKPLKVLRRAKKHRYYDRTTGRLLRLTRFRNWGESDTFPKNRFNPDHVPQPLRARA